MSVKYLSQEEAINIDKELFNGHCFVVDQLMELAGLGVAKCIYKSYPNNDKPILIVCGPGNNGGDGLVAARHLKHFGYNPFIFYPKQGKSILFEKLVAQCKHSEIDFIDKLESIDWKQFGIIVDGLFGFSFKPPLKEDSMLLVKTLSELDRSRYSIVSIDIPSGWHVENGPPNDGTTPVIQPDCLISLTAPKKCATHFTGRLHWLSGRFIPTSLAQKYQLNLPKYPGAEQCVLLTESKQ